jgi:hypothetical protein
MVIVKLKGGLGNQLFQYAVGRRIAYERNTVLKLDRFSYERKPLRSYRLGHFNIVEHLASPWEVARCGQLHVNRLLKRAYQLATRLAGPYTYSVIDEHDPDSLERALADRPGDIYLTGYWQSESFFKPIEDIVRQELTVKTPPTPANAVLAQEMARTESISLHVRRGDYVTDPKTFRRHGVCSLEYYAAAINRLSQTVREPHFYVFSDDMEWVRENLKLAHPVTYVAHNGAEQDYEDLRLMAHCRHHIIANSTFSWWGAWLCAHPGKTVIAPHQWFADPARDTSYLIPPAWHRI